MLLPVAIAGSVEYTKTPLAVRVFGPTGLRHLAHDPEGSRLKTVRHDVPAWRSGFRPSAQNTSRHDNDGKEVQHKSHHHVGPAEAFKLDRKWASLELPNLPAHGRTSTTSEVEQ